jgi:hypothetical protein
LQQNQGLIEYQSRQNQTLIENQLIYEREDNNTKLVAELEKKNQNLERQNHILDNEIEGLIWTKVWLNSNQYWRAWGQKYQTDCWIEEKESKLGGTESKFDWIPINSGH